MPCRLALFLYLLMLKQGREKQVGMGSSTTQQPKRHDFERDSHKMALKIAPAKKFLLNVQPESRPAIGERICTDSTICGQRFYPTKKDFFHF
jgi:hypothetical protein